ncbi:hypothetical protein FACS189450_09200 [Spirochaetia bacterium]|nr:hypothetical protein FACS189450_09200 [Spirochaetia bacterium]
MKSVTAMTNDRFLRNSYVPGGKYGMPIIYKQAEINLENLEMLGFNNIKQNDERNKNKTIHFFIDDYHFDAVWSRPKNYIHRLKQYRQIISPDFSLLTDMPLAVQIFNTFRRRWCSAYWQEQGMIVIPAICWGDERSYEFCFDGISPGSIIAVSTLGTGKIDAEFMKGYKIMLEKICPSKIICYGTLYKGMQNNADIVHIPLVWNSLRKINQHIIPGQFELF